MRITNVEAEVPISVGVGSRVGATPVGVGLVDKDPFGRAEVPPKLTITTNILQIGAAS